MIESSSSAVSITLSSAPRVSTFSISKRPVTRSSSVPANQVGRAAIAEQQSECPKEERFARPGFTRPGAKPRLQFDADVRDQGQVLHGEFTEHGETEAGGLCGTE